MREKMDPCRAAGVLAAVALAGLVGVAMPRPAVADVLGDPTLTTPAGTFGVGGELDFVFDKDLENGAPADLEMTQIFGTGSYGFTNTVDGFVKLGLWNGEIENADIDPGLAIAAGGRWAFMDQGDLRFGASAKLAYYMSELDTANSPDIDFFEINIAPGVSFRGLGPIIPYGGVTFSWLDGDIEGNDFEGDDIFGLYGGVTYAITPSVHIGGELRLIDQGALSVFASFRF